MTKTKTIAACLFLLGVLFPDNAVSQSYPPPALYGADALGREMPSAPDVREFRQDRYVGVFYFLWLRLNHVHDSSLILKQNPRARSTSASPPWGPFHAYHFWGEPMFGYYRSDDAWVLRRHAALLSDAGVDFLVFDTTNAVTYDNVVMRLCEEFEQQRKLGEHVPQITFMVNTRAGQTAQRIYETYYKPSLYPELWFRWDGKPLLICDPDAASQAVSDFFTLRKAHWPFKLENTKNAWHWEATYPQVYSYEEDPTEPEQVNVSVGQNLHQKSGRVEMMSTGRARGRSFHGGRVNDRPSAYEYGFNFEEQWKRAFDLDPEVVFVTGWNEWIAMQLNKNEGPPVFCDQFDLEFSRDVEMMKGGHADNYYMQMAANIRRFKGMRRASQAPKGKVIDMAASVRQWDSVGPVYRDRARETLPRDFPGCGDEHYRVHSGRNDFRTAKVTHDGENVYFYAQTAQDITACTDPNWMWLLIKVADNDGPDWEGFQFIVNRSVASSTAGTFEICEGGWQWRYVNSVGRHVEGRHLQMAVPKRLLGIRGEEFILEFKWIDNTQNPGDILDVYTHGDSAPGGRFCYRYDTHSRAAN